MKIGSPTASVGANFLSQSVVPATTANLRSDDRFSRSLLNSRRNGYLEIAVGELLKPVVETDTGHFAIETSIGDDAIRFDARPIVAPASFSDTSNADKPANSIALVSPEPAEPQRDRTIDALIYELAEKLPVIEKHAAQLSREAGPAPTSPRGIGNGAAFVLPVGSPSIRAETENSINASPPRASSKSALRYVPPPGSGPRTLVQLAALPREIVVILRGVSLSAEESLSLTEKMRSVLAQYHLGDRLIKIVGTGDRP